jgi:hypothetical protein
MNLQIASGHPYIRRAIARLMGTTLEQFAGVLKIAAQHGRFVAIKTVVDTLVGRVGNDNGCRRDDVRALTWQAA